MSKVQLTINGQSVTAESGQTILEAAQAAGIHIPTLCHHPALSNHGACRVCLVEVKGMRGLQTSCTCPVAEGMEVQTETEAVVEARAFSLQLLFSERNHYCMICQESGDCELQELAYEHGLDHWRYPRAYERMAVDASHPYIIIEPNRCVLCTRCVRACAEIAANHTLSLRERGSETMICADTNVPLGESTCVSCGMCLQVCPTGALIDARSAYGGHEEELVHTLSTCIQCSVGCSIDIVSRGSRVLRVDGVWDSSPSDGLLCVDGRFKPLYEERKRITAPQMRLNGKLAETTWEEALATIVEKLTSESVVGLTSCATTNEALDAFAELIEKVNGKAGRLAPPMLELNYGESARLGDIENADFIVVAGTDPLDHHKVVGYLIKRAVDRGARLALVGELENALSDYASFVVPYAETEKVVALAAQTNCPIVIYGAELVPAAAASFAPLAARARFLALNPVCNGKGAKAAGLAPTAPHDAGVLYFLLGEQCEEEKLAEQINGAFVIVQASYTSQLIERADVVLPAPIWAERSGHVTNVEGNTLSLNPAVPMPDGVRDETAVLLNLLAELADS
jgi:formate dehydrogenase major subunit